MRFTLGTDQERFTYGHINRFVNRGLLNGDARPIDQLSFTFGNGSSNVAAFLKFYFGSVCKLLPSFVPLAPWNEESLEYPLILLYSSIIHLCAFTNRPTACEIHILDSLTLTMN